MSSIENLYQKKNEIYAHLKDEESRTLFDARLKYALDGDQGRYMATLDTIYRDWVPSMQLEERIRKGKPKGFIVYGCGYAGKRIKTMMESFGHQVSYFCDTYRCGGVIDGIEVLSVDEVAEQHQDYMAIISSYEYSQEMRAELLKRGFPEENIFPKERMLSWSRGRQYFDLFPPDQEEIFVDAGAFDGETTIDFMDWAQGKQKEIFVIEPLEDMYKAMQEKFGKNEKIHLFQNAVWDQKETLQLSNQNSGSAVNEKGELRVDGVDIDSIVGDAKVTFIKMDVEGSELKALMGAKRTIVRNHPKLAICIYHKPMDILEIPAYILELVPEYDFYIRHYCSHMWETVLYATVRED